MGYVVALLWVCGLAAAGLALCLVWVLTHPGEWSSLDEHADFTRALSPRSFDGRAH